MTIATALDPLLEAVIPAVRRAERFLGPEDDWVEDDRRILYEAAQRHLGRFHTFTREKGAADYVTTAHADSDAVEVALMEYGYDRNLLSTRKYREHHDGGKQSGEPSASPNGSPDGRPSGRQWAVGSFAYDPEDTDWQHHVYLFQAPNGATDVYGHREPSPRNPEAHLDRSTGVHGDPNGRVANALDVYRIEYGERETLK